MTATIVFSFVRSSDVLCSFNKERGYKCSIACAGCHVSRLAEGAGTSYKRKKEKKIDQRTDPQPPCAHPFHQMNFTHAHRTLR